MYVGVTRLMCAPQLMDARRRAVFGAQQYGLRSRFLDEIPRELTDGGGRIPARSAPARACGPCVVGVIAGGVRAPSPGSAWAATTWSTRRSARES